MINKKDFQKIKQPSWEVSNYSSASIKISNHQLLKFRTLMTTQEKPTLLTKVVDLEPQDKEKLLESEDTVEVALFRRIVSN